MRFLRLKALSVQGLSGLAEHCKSAMATISVTFLVLFQGSASAGPLYDNGAPMWTTGRNIGFGVLVQDYRVSNSFALSQSAVLDGVTFASWVPSASEVQSLDWAIGASFFDQSIASGHVSAAQNQLMGFNGSFALNLTTFQLPDIYLDEGIYFLTLNMARNDQGGTVFWDVSDGQSLARQTDAGAIESNSFQVFGEVPEPGTVSMMVLALAFLFGVMAKQRRRRVTVFRTLFEQRVAAPVRYKTHETWSPRDL